VYREPARWKSVNYAGRGRKTGHCGRSGVDGIDAIGDGPAKFLTGAFQMQGQTRAICAALSMFCLAVAGGTAGASEASRAPAIEAAGPVAAPTDVSSQARSKRRALRRVHIYGRSRGPGPNSVRICNAHYEQEFRPSGTVIVPRMHCYWSG
jgi:hypothetical protein